LLSAAEKERSFQIMNKRNLLPFVTMLLIALSFFHKLVVPKPGEPSISLGLTNKDQLQLRRQRQVWFISIVDKAMGVQVKL